jgi:cytochrome c oxidase subunit 1
VLYLIYALFAGLIGTAFSVLIRLELSGPGVQYIADNQLYNSIITAHAIIMIFFMVEKKLILKFQLSPFFYKVDNDNNNLSLNVHNDPNLNGNQNFNDNNEHKNDKKHNYIKVLVDDPFNNRNIILNVTKSQKGIYI